jgi:8-oxo-dGTP pyrophosphatase MutT (NUDIX family)
MWEINKPPFGRPEEKRWRVLASEVLLHNPWFRVLQSRVQMPDQRETRYYSLDFPRPAVGVVPRREGEVLLIRQYRFLVDQFVWAIPSGGVDPGEDALTAARRELAEETGHQAREVRRLHAYYPSYGCGNQEFHLFEALDVTPLAGSFDRNEVLEVRWFAHAEVKGMLLAEQILDGLTLTPLLFLCAREGW